MLDVQAKCGGELGIRTLEGDKPLHAFQACSFSHSDSSPIAKLILLSGADNRELFLLNQPLIAINDELYPTLAVDRPLPLITLGDHG